MMKNKLLLLLALFTLSIATFGQYTEDKLPSGLTLTTSLGDSDYTIVQKNGEVIVKAVRFDTTCSAVEQYINTNMHGAGTGNLIYTDGANFRTSASLKHEGNGVITLGTSTGTVGYYSLNVSGGTPNTMSGSYGIVAGANNVNAENSSIVVGQNNTLPVLGGFSFSSIFGYSNTAAGYNSHMTGTGLNSHSYRQILFGSYNKTASGQDIDSWVATDHLFVIGNGATSGARSDALVMLKNGNTTATGDWTIDGDLSVTGAITSTDVPFVFGYFGDSAVIFTFAATDTWYHLTNDTDSAWIYSELDNVTVSNDTLTFANTGHYNLDFHLSFIGGNQDVYAVRFYNVTQGVGIPTTVGQTGQGALDVVSLNITSHGIITAGDEVVLQIKCDDTENATFKNSTIRIQYIHE